MRDNGQLWQGEFWQINLNTAFGIPGYLFVNSLGDATGRFGTLDPAGFAEMGHAIGLATRAVERILDPAHVFAGKFGMVPGHAVHFHVIPVDATLLAAFEADTRWHGFRAANPAGYPAVPDAAELIAFLWRDLCFTGKGADDIDHVALGDRLSDEIARLDRQGA